jgi:hypothetical protein
VTLLQSLISEANGNHLSRTVEERLENTGDKVNVGVSIQTISDDCCVEYEEETIKLASISGPQQSQEATVSGCAGNLQNFKLLGRLGEGAYS